MSEGARRSCGPADRRSADQRGPFRNFYGRRHGKRLRPSQRRLLEEMLDQIAVPGLPPARSGEPGEVDLRALFGRDCPVWLEIGFGSGEHMAHQAARHPEAGILGCEPYVNGVASLLGKLRDSPLPNVRIHPGDVRDLMDVLPAGSVSRTFLLYPDPWPKKRHHRRRFMTPEHLRPLARAMKPGSRLRVATDIPDYARQAVEQIARSADFEWTAESRRDWQRPWDDWLPTRYEIKALKEERVPIYLNFTRL